ncbi:CTD small phosphatase-like protein [Linum perenne]
MVRKICSKRSPAKSVRDLRSQRRRNLRKKTIGCSSVDISSASCSTALVSSISTRVSKCKNRILRIFSKFASFVSIETPKTSSRYRGYQILNEARKQSIAETGDSVRKVLFFDNFSLPPTSKPTVFLDLDETLIHSFPDNPPKSFDFVVRPKIGGADVTFYVLKRPGLDEFLTRLAEKFEIVVFTAGLEVYATLVLDQLDKEKKLITHRLYRDSCKQVDGMYVKDLSRTGRDLSNAVIVDDNPNAYSLQPENAIPVRQFVGDAGDVELKELGKFFDGGFDHGGDVRDAVKLFVSGRDNVWRIVQIPMVSNADSFAKTQNPNFVHWFF